jgi:hypothetical protein
MKQGESMAEKKQNNTGNSELGKESLREWNRLNKEITENAMIASIFEAGCKSSKSIDQFSSWLIVGAAAIASFFITNSNQLLPLLEPSGFMTCGVILCASCFFGLISKIYALMCKIGIDVVNTLRITLEEHLKRFEESKEEIKKGEKFWEITLETNIDFQKVLTRFYEYQPIWVRWQLSSYMKKYGSDPMAGYFIPFKYMTNQNVLFVLQAIIFLFFLIAGFAFIVC